MLRATRVYEFVPFVITMLLSAEIVLVVLLDGVLFSAVEVADLWLVMFSSTGLMRPDVGFVTLEP